MFLWKIDFPGYNCFVFKICLWMPLVLKKGLFLSNNLTRMSCWLCAMVLDHDYLWYAGRIVHWSLVGFSCFTWYVNLYYTILASHYRFCVLLILLLFWLDAASYCILHICCNRASSCFSWKIIDVSPTNCITQFTWIHEVFFFFYLVAIGCVYFLNKVWFKSQVTCQGGKF